MAYQDILLNEHELDNIMIALITIKGEVYVEYFSNCIIADDI